MGFTLLHNWDNLPPFFESQNAIEMEWKAIQNKQYRLHLELFVGDTPTGVIILEENVEESTIKKLSPRQRNKWYELVELDNSLPF